MFHSSHHALPSGASLCPRRPAMSLAPLHSSHLAPLHSSHLAPPSGASLCPAPPHYVTCAAAPSAAQALARQRLSTSQAPSRICAPKHQSRLCVLLQRHQRRLSWQQKPSLRRGWQLLGDIGATWRCAAIGATWRCAAIGATWRCAAIGATWRCAARVVAGAVALGDLLWHRVIM
jgi:hypothetical protein